MSADANDVADLFRPRFIQRFADFMGFELIRWIPDEVEIAMTLQRHHQNPTGAAHGGVMLALLDTAVTLAGCWAPSLEERRTAVTLSLGTTFVAAPVGDRLIVIGRKRGGGRRVYMATAEVMDADGRLIAIGEGALSYRTTRPDPKS